MSKCIKCGRELTSAEIPEFYNGMCEKCYKEKNYAEYPFKQGINDYQQQIDQLKQQLAEKDKEIEHLVKRIDKYENLFRSRIARTGDIQKDIELYVKQLTIQELEKVKNYFIEECEDGDGIKTEDRVIKKDIYEVADFIENQIKELKGNNDEPR